MAGRKLDGDVQGERSAKKRERERSWSSVAVAEATLGRVLFT